MGKITFIIGGARSGKTAYAIEKAKVFNQKVAYIATAPCHDNSMKSRINHHKKERPAGWTTIEEEKDLALSINTISADIKIIIIDCLTLFISNHMLDNIEESVIFDKIKILLTTIKQKDFDCLIISNEVGLGIHPDNKLALNFIDVAGKVNQIVAQNADEVYFVVSGIPVKIK